MRCKHCGSENTNDAKFCEVCGSRLEEAEQETYEEAASEEVYEQPGEETYESFAGTDEKGAAEDDFSYAGGETVYENSDKEDGPEIFSGDVIDKHSSEYSQAKPDNSYREYNVKTAAISGLRSPFMLAGTLLMGAQVILMLMCAFSSFGGYIASFITVLYFFKNPVLVFRIAVCIAAAVETALFVGFIMTFISALGKKDVCRTAGLTVLQVLCAAGVIIVCFIFLCAIGAGLVFSRYYTVYYGLSTLGMVQAFSPAYVILTAAAAVAVFAIALLFFAKLLRTVGKAKKAAAYGIAKKNVSLYCAVVLFIIAAGILAVCIASLFTWIPASLILNISELCLAAACVFYGIFIINFRKRLRAVL